MQRYPKQLVSTQLITDVAAVYYTAENVTGDIASATVTNTSATAETISLSLVASGGTPGNSNLVVKSRAVPANGSVQLWEIIGQKIPSGTTIQALATTTGVLTLSIGGYEVV